MAKAQDRRFPRFKTIIDYDKCIKCGRCGTNCTYNCIIFDKEQDRPIVLNPENCVACQRCTTFCPVDAIEIHRHKVEFAPHPTWTPYHIRSIVEQAKTGAVLLSGMGNDRPYPMVFDYLVWDACQVTNPAIDALREPVETRTYLGRKPERLSIKKKGGKYELEDLPPNAMLSMPLIIGHMSLGSLSYNSITSM
jgi:Fe-S-cluster-containing hydrogenase component 2